MAEVQSSSKIQGAKLEEPAKLHKCVMCYNATGKHKVDGCEHYFCQGCLRSYMQRVIDDKKNYPPRCCKVEIRLGGQSLEFLVQDIFQDEYFEAAYREMVGKCKTEYLTYCVKCKKAVKPIHQHFAHCEKCGTTTCTWCKEEGPLGHVCSRGESDKEHESLAGELKWKRCYNCGEWVEKFDGCNEIV